MSAIGYSGDREDDEVTDDSPAGTGFLAALVRAWESAADPARDAGVRLVHPRMAVVMHPDGGMLTKLLPIFRLGAGGVIGSGRQWLPWISLTDALRALSWAALHDSLSGPIIVSSPNPVRNADFTRALAGAVHRPAFARVPGFAVKLMYGEMGEETVLAGQRAVPRQLLESGFQFEYPVIEQALAHELKQS
jgi:uncharacterized protein (TIGR01777 family)